MSGGRGEWQADDSASCGRASSRLLRGVVLATPAVAHRPTLAGAVAIGVLLALAVVSTSLWSAGRPRWVVRPVLASTGAAWLAFHVLPFTATALSDPYRLPFHGTNYTENVAGLFQSDHAVREAAATLNRIAPDHVVATWHQCQLIFHYLDQPPQCLERYDIATDLRSALDSVPEGTSLYLAFSDYPPFFQDWHDTQFEVVATYQRERIHRPVSVVRLWR